MVPVRTNQNMPEVIFPDMSALPAMFQNAMPPAIPQMEYKPGLITIVENFVQNIKLGQIEKASEREANISENNLRRLRANLESIQELISFGQTFEFKVKSLRANIEMIEINKQMAQAQLISLQLKNVQDQNEAKLLELELKQRIREMENGINEA